MQSPAALPESPPPSHPERPARGDWWAVCLCAAWCGTCGIYRPLFDELARAHPDVRFEWVDIEDESDIAGDLDVETFPTLLIADGERALFWGPCCPRRPCWRGCWPACRPQHRAAQAQVARRSKCLSACVPPAARSGLWVPAAQLAPTTVLLLFS